MRRFVVILGILFAVLSAALIFLVFLNQEDFTGSRTRNPDSYSIDFSRMNQVDTHSLVLEKGDVLEVSYSIEKGKVSLEIAKEGGRSVYRGDGLGQGNFSVLVEESGTHRITVTAKHAKGFVHIRKR